MHELSEDFNKVIGNMKKNPSELKNTLTEVKNTPEGVSGGLEAAGDQFSDPEDRTAESTQAEQHITNEASNKQ